MKDNVVLIIGATSMIGDACARLFSQCGMKLMLVARDEKKLRKLTDELNKNVEFCIADLSSPDQINLIVNKTLKSFNRIDAVIATMAMFLISDKAKNMTGQNFIIDGGQTIGTSIA